ncbi:MAG TPA: hypothetical protein GXX64_09665 [Bacteroidales bacterium]|nr:hypothetical protein [Bacteroidales bacterium]
MKRDIRKVFGLVLRYMDLPEGDTKAKRRWEREVREAYPYGRMILTAPLGEIVDLQGRSA